MLLFTFQFYDGTFLRLSTHPLNVAEGGAQYGGHDYFARIAMQTLGAVQERSEQGIEKLPSISVKILDDDFFVWSNYESTLGFRDATCTVQLIFGETNGYTFSSDSYSVFIGICDAPVSIDPDGTITISAASSNNLQKKYLPVLQAQARCPYTFPATAAQRLAAGTDRYSLFFSCGYNPDQAGTDPDTGGSALRGNGLFTTCNLTKGDCVARGMYTKDSTNRITGRYGGIQWVPDSQIKNYINYGTGNKVPSFRLANGSIMGKPIPLGYGTAWGAPLIANTIGDGNLTRFELIVCGGNIGPYNGNGPILQVVMNGVTVPHNTGSSDPTNNGLRWDLVTQGLRSGAPTADAGYNSQGDPYGGIAMAYAVLFVELAASNAVPSVNVLAQRLWVKQPNTTNPADVNSWPYSYSDNPAFCVADLLLRAGLRWADLNIQSFITAAAICATAVSYIDNNGNTNSHARYIIGTYIGDAKLGSELLNSMLRGFNAQVYRDKVTGLVGIMIRQSIADQQPAPIDGSNYNTGITAIIAAGGTGTGYPAYAFDESNTVSIRTVMSPNAASGNKIIIPILDADNGFVQDWSSVTDVDDAARGQWANSGSIVNSNFVATGITSFDQAFRVSRTYLAEQLRGNEQQDTRGTRRFEIKTTFRISHLRVGQIVLCRFSQPPNSYTSVDTHLAGLGFLGRVIKIEGTTNFEQMTTTVEWTESSWYADAFGQSVPPQYSDPRKNPPNRPSLPWHNVDLARPFTDALFPGTPTFSIVTEYTTNTDGSAQVVADIGGAAVVNVTSNLVHPPQVGRQAVVASSGGNIPSGTYHFTVTAVDSNGDESGVSSDCKAYIAPGTTTAVVSIPIPSYDAATVSFNVYGGLQDPTQTWQANALVGALVGGAINLTALFSPTIGGPPDINFDHFHFYGRKIFKAGIWEGALVTATVIVPGGPYVRLGIPAFTDNFAGRVVSKLGAIPGGVATGPFDASSFGITSSATPNLHMNQSALSISTNGIAFSVGDFVTIRAQANIFSANTIGDALYVNSLNPSGLAVDAFGGDNVLIIAGAGAGQERTILSNTNTTLTINGVWGTIPDATSVFIIIDSHYPYDVTGKKLNTATSGIIPGNSIGSLPLDNQGGQSFLIEVQTEDVNNASFPDLYAPFRELYVFGQAGPNTAGGGYSTVPLDGSNNFNIDLANGLNFRIVLDTTTATGVPAATIATIVAPIFTGGTISAGMSFTLYIDQDATGGWPVPNFAAGAGGFASDVPLQGIAGDLSTRTTYILTWHGTVWGLDSFRTGGALS